MVDRFVKGKEASIILRIHQRTLYQWEAKGWIDTKRTKVITDCIMLINIYDK